MTARSNATLPQHALGLGASRALVRAAFGDRSPRRSVLNLAGVRPVRRTLTRGGGPADPDRVEGWLRRMREPGAPGR